MTVHAVYVLPTSL